MLVLGALAAVLPVSLASLQDPGPHGFSEILYAYSSAHREQRLGLRRLHAPTRVYHNTMLGLAMLFGRFAMIVPMLAVAGCARGEERRRRPRPAPSRPTRRCSSCCSSRVILIIGGLTFFPALALGPIAEHFAMLAGQTF